MFRFFFDQFIRRDKISRARVKESNNDIVIRHQHRKTMFDMYAE